MAESGDLDGKLFQRNRTMQILLASAKIMKERCKYVGITPHVPLFQEQALSLAEDLSHFTAMDLAQILSCSPVIGEQNRQRFEIFGTDEAEIMPAVLTYWGQAYKHLRADLMEEDELLWADRYLWISSCLYGLLRPLDGINTYRMEGGIVLPSTGGKRVFEYWRPLLTETLIESVKADDGILVYLDTEEFRTLFDWKKIVSEVPVIIEPRFHVVKNGKLTTPSVWTKTCRGSMVRFIIKNRIRHPSLLKDFSYEGFSFKEEKGGLLVFVKDVIVD